MPLSIAGPAVDGPTVGGEKAAARPGGNALTVPRQRPGNILRAQTGPESLGETGLLEDPSEAIRPTASANPLLSEAIRPTASANPLLSEANQVRGSVVDASGEKEFTIAITKRLQSFQESRKEECKREFHAVLTAGFAVAVAGLLLLFISMPIREWVSRPWGHVGTALGASCFGAGVVWLSTCPADQVDVDELFFTRPRLRVVVGLGLALVNGIGGALTPPHMRLLAALSALALAYGENTSREPEAFGRTLTDNANSTGLTAKVRLQQEQLQRHWPNDQLQESPTNGGGDDEETTRFGDLDPLDTYMGLHPTSLLVLTMVFNLLAGFSACIWRGLSPRFGLEVVNVGMKLPAEAWLSVAPIFLVGLLLLVPRWLLLRHRHRKTGGEAGHSRTTALYEALYIENSVQGLSEIALGILTFGYRESQKEESHPIIASACSFVRGLGYVLPILVSLTLGKERLFQISAQRFNWNTSRAQRDGAFIAQLLDSMPVRVGQVWWAHRADGEKDHRYLPTEHKHNWRKGRIVETSPTDFAVELAAETMDAADGWGAGTVRTIRRSSIFARQTSAPKVPPAPAPSPADRWRKGKAGVLNRSTSGLGRRNVPKGEVVRFALAALDTPWQELMRVAQESLRCIEWRTMTRQLIGSGAICGAAGAADAENLGANSYYAMSRPVREGETIDYFLSHSWHDDAEAKYEALECICEDFQYENRRPPTFWLDKVCIDQLNIADGLRVLPVSVMACRRMLVMVGTTYQRRLWCIWELFTLLAFMETEEAMERLHLVPLDSDESPGHVAVELQSFDVWLSQCYDPNEEARLRRIISALGAHRFNERIRDLGRSCELLEERRKKAAATKSGGIRPLSWIGIRRSRHAAASVDAPTSPRRKRGNTGGEGPANIELCSLTDYAADPPGSRPQSKSVSFATEPPPGE